MIQFANEHIRTAFHSLPIDRQMDFQDMAMRYAKQGYVMRVDFIETVRGGQLEVSVGILKQFNFVPVVDADATGTD